MIVPMLRLIVAFLALAGCVSLGAAEVKVFAAASLSDSLKEVAQAYEKKVGDKILFNFGASSTLARQIVEGAPADVFFSADEVKMDDLEKAALLAKGSRKSLLGNSLVVVVAADSPLALKGARDLAGSSVKRLALADPKAVPAGVYARSYLRNLELWEAIAPKVVPTENVRAALAAVESGNVDAGIVYKTDAAISKKVKVAYEVPRDESPDISYPVALIKDAKGAGPAGKFLTHLSSPEAGQVFTKFGFVVRNNPSK
jgi:molybdate transport system substrate-binding protein